jgi:hypothetical protein
VRFRYSFSGDYNNNRFKSKRQELKPQPKQELKPQPKQGLQLQEPKQGLQLQEPDEEEISDDGLNNDEIKI